MTADSTTHGLVRADHGIPRRRLRSRARPVGWKAKGWYRSSTAAAKAAGRLELCTLESLRDSVNPAPGGGVRTTMRCLAEDARALHSAPEFACSLFQVASQFNLLEMVSPKVTPVDG